MTRKTWVIPGNLAGLHGNGAVRARLRGDASLPDEDHGESPRPRAVSRAPSSYAPRHPGRTLFWSYFLGPLGLLVSNDGRSRPIWVVMAGLSLGAAVLAARHVTGIAGALREGDRLGILILSLIVGALAVGSAAWARAVLSGGREAGLAASTDRGGAPSPGWAFALGLLFPGLGLHLSRSPGRAAAALVGMGWFAVGAVVLLFAAPLWTWNHVSPLGGAPDLAMEIVYLAAAALCGIGTLVWFAQALDGMRQAALCSPSRSLARGDGFGLALLAALIIFAAGFRPALWAAEFDGRAEWAEAKGLQLTLLGLAEAARRLDPSRPDYALRAAALHDARGHHAAAASIRGSLGRSWSLYLAGMGGDSNRGRASAFGGRFPAALDSARFEPAGPMLESLGAGCPGPAAALE